MRHALLLLAFLVFASVPLLAQAPRGYPAPPRGLPEAEEIALAVSAAPEEISAQADVYVLRGTDYVKVRSGTNGCACMVARDLHDGSRYPICYDQEGARTSMAREIMEGSLRAKGLAEAEVQRRVTAAYGSGALRMPAKASMAYMMSPRQVLFSDPDSSGFRVGAWSPHLMLMLPNVEPQQLGLAAQSNVDILQIHSRGSGHSELIVKVPTWSNGQPAGNARPADDEAAIRQAVQYYFDGSRNADSATMRKGFRTDVAHMFFVRDSQLVDVPIPEFLARVAGGRRPGFQPDTLRRRVVMIDVAGNAAVAKLETVTPGQRVVDYMSLLKINGRWQIVTKIFDRLP